MTAHQTLCFQVYTMEQDKRGHCSYEDKRYLLAELPNKRSNSHKNAYGHRELATEEHLVADLPEPGGELIIRHREERFTRQHGREARRLERAGVLNMEEE